MVMPSASKAAVNHLQPSTNILKPPILSSETYGWQNILVREFEQPPSQEVYQSTTENLLCLSLNSRPVRVFQRLDSCHYTALFTQGDLSIIPAGAQIFSQWHHNEKYLQIQLANNFLEQVAQSTFKDRANVVNLPIRFRTRDPQIEHISMMLLAELRSGASTGPLYIESLTNVLAIQLLKGYSAIQPHVSLDEARLRDRQLLQVTDYINAHLSNPIQLADLAALLNLSQFHFIRLFKQSTGVTPYQYLLQQRIERAKVLLKTTTLSVMEIALLCGFSSHSHLGKQFRQHTGVTPKRYRTD